MHVPYLSTDEARLWMKLKFVLFEMILTHVCIGDVLVDGGSCLRYVYYTQLGLEFKCCPK